MDTHLAIKIVHMSGAAVAMILYLVCGLSLFVGLQAGQPNPKTRKVFTAILHASLGLLLLTGGVLLVMNQFQVQPWFYAKAILFIVMFSSLIKAFKRDSNVLLAQRRAGWVIAGVAFASIIGLVLMKPVFS